MARSKFVVSLLVVVAFCVMAGTSFAAAKKPKCAFNGDYSFFFWDPSRDIAGVGYFGVNCAGRVLPGGIIDCNYFAAPPAIGNEYAYEDFIEDGFVFLERDGEGTMEIETNSSHGICDTGKNALELDISVVLGGKTVLFNSDGEAYAGSGLIPQAGYDYTLTGRADKCFAGQISGCYDVRFWTAGGINRFAIINPDQAFDGLNTKVGDCTICVNGAGGVTGGSCRCNTGGIEGSLETLSEIVAGGYTLGENCQSSTGYLWFTTSSDLICDEESSLALDFAVAQGGKELMGACDPAPYILNNTSLRNAGFFIPCAFEGWLR